MCSEVGGRGTKGRGGVDGRVHLRVRNNCFSAIVINLMLRRARWLWYY